MTTSDDEDESLAHFLESEILSEVSDQEEGNNFAEIGKGKEEGSDRSKAIYGVAAATNNNNNNKYGSASCNRIDDSIINNNKSMRIEGGVFSKMPPELFPHILKFLSSEDLVSCSLVCRSLNYAASDESLWRRLYCMRWGLLPPSKKSTQYAWKKLYIQRDEEDMVKLVRNCPPEFKEYYLQMQASKRSQAPLPSQVIGDQIILDKTVSDQVSIWKGKKGLGDKVVRDHTCTGDSCSFFKIGDVFVCEKTGNVHVCDDTCREVVMDPTNQLFVCTISGHCFDRLVGPSELDPDPDQQQGGVTDEQEVESFLGSGRLGRAYSLGYNCDDEEELEATLRFC